MTTQETALTDEAFSVAIRSQTWNDHADAEGTNYVKALFGGQLTQDGYAALVAQHYFAYNALEEAAYALAEDPVAKPFLFPEFERMPSLELDLVYLFGADWADKITPNKATEAYVARLREVCFDWPGGFIAHQYTRYLGDLSGGQAIGAAVTRAYDLPETGGARFYVFEGIKNPKEFKDRYREALDSVPFDAAERERVIAEVGIAYHHNSAVMAELGQDPTLFKAQD